MEFNLQGNEKVAQISSGQLDQQIPVLYLWFGKEVPEDYLISMSEMTYPIVFLKNPQIKRKFKRQLLDIEKADYFRLWYLYEHGGIYSDFDNTIDYPCLLDLLKPYQSQNRLVFMTDGRHTKKKTQEVTTNLIFAPSPKLAILKKMLDSLDETKQKVWQFAGIKFIGKFEQIVEVQMSRCVQHSYDWSWYQASNQVKGTNTEAHKKFIKKSMKKSEILRQKQEFQKELKQLKIEKNQFQGDLKLIKGQKQQLQFQVSSFIKKIQQSCPLSLQIIENYKSLALDDKNMEVQKSNKKIGSQANQLTGQASQYQNDKNPFQSKILELSNLNKELQLQNEIKNLEANSIIVVFIITVILLFFCVRKKQQSNTVQPPQPLQI